MKKNLIILTVLLLLVISSHSLTKDDIDWSKHKTEQFGYYIHINDHPVYPYIIFKSIKDKKIIAIYHYGDEKWLSLNKDLDMSHVDFSIFYLKDSSNKNQDENLTQNKKEQKNNKSDQDKKSKKNKNTKQNKKNQNLLFSLKNNLDNTLYQGYKIKIFAHTNQIKLVDPDYSHYIIGVYNYDKMWWEGWSLLRKHYTDIDLTHFFENMNYDQEQQYQRWNQNDPNIYILNSQKKYNYRNDRLVKNFINYLKRVNAGEKEIDYYLRLMNDPKMLKWMHQVLSQVDNGYYPSREYFKNHKTVPITIVELFPKKPTGYVNAFTGNELVKVVKKETEFAFDKPVKITYKQTLFDYAKLGTIPAGQYRKIYQDKYLEESLDHLNIKDELIFYYFADRTRMFQFRKIIVSRSIGKGAGCADWDWNGRSAIHEMGHYLILGHHHTGNSEPFDVNNMTSRKCIMNYGRMKSTEFCYLCKYLLGIEN